MRGDGKTTRLLEEAIDALATLPDGDKVYITGAHSNWVRQLEREFKDNGLVGVVFLRVDPIRDGYLRGARGVLLIDDYYDLSIEDQTLLDFERLLIRR